MDPILNLLLRGLYLTCVYVCMYVVCNINIYIYVYVYVYVYTYYIYIVVES